MMELALSPDLPSSGLTSTSQPAALDRALFLSCVLQELKAASEFDFGAYLQLPFGADEFESVGQICSASAAELLKCIDAAEDFLLDKAAALPTPRWFSLLFSAECRMRRRLIAECGASSQAAERIAAQHATRFKRLVDTIRRLAH